MSQKVVIVTAPSGAGKTTIVRALLRDIPEMVFSVSACTRARREFEREGVDYYFLSKEDFIRKIGQGEFLEWEEVYRDNFYGTLKSEVDRIWNDGNVIIFDVDVKGAENLKKYFGDKALAMFIKPPSLETLVERLSNRRTETPENLQKRIARATMELNYEDRFDVVVVNDNLEEAIGKAKAYVLQFIEN